MSSGGPNYNCKIKLATPHNGNSINGKANIVLQAIAKDSYSRSDFVIGVGNNMNNSDESDPNDTYMERMRIPYDAFTQFFISYNTTTFGGWYYGDYAYGNYINSTNWNVVTKHNGAIWTTHYLVSTSDRDIKKDIEELKDDECLKKILLLKPSKYRYIDKSKNISENKTYGYIAQEVAEVFPEAVRYEEDYIPNALCFVNIDNGILIIDNNRPDTYTLILSVSLKIKLYDEFNNKILVEITEVIDDNNFKVNKELNNSKYFLYGSLKKDFNILAKEYINAVHVSATQELYRIIQRQQTKIIELENNINMIRTHLHI